MSEQTIDYSVSDTAARPWNPPAELLMFGDGFIVELVTIFRTNTDLILSRFGAFLSEADFDGVKTAAHTIKGSARQMGAEVVASICEEVEVAASDSGASKLEERVACLRAAFSSLGVEMSAFSASVQTKALQFAVPSPK